MSEMRPAVPPSLDESARAVLRSAAAQRLRRGQSSAHREPAVGAIWSGDAYEPVLPTADSAADIVTDEDRALAVSAPSRPLSEVLDGRRSATSRLFRTTKVDLVTVLRRSYRVVDSGLSADSPTPWSLRPTPSAGATHPFDLLVAAHDVQGMDPGFYVFGPSAVSLRALAPELIPFAQTLSQEVRRAARRATSAPATVYLVADASRTGARYSAPLTLILRDAGALLATLHLAASDLGMRSSIVGTAGHFLDSIADSHGGGADTGAPTRFDCGAVVLGRS